MEHEIAATASVPLPQGVCGQWVTDGTVSGDLGTTHWFRLILIEEPAGTLEQPTGSDLGGHSRVSSESVEGHSGVIPGSFQGHSGVIRGSFRGHSRVIPGSFQGHSRVIPGSFWGHSRVIPGSFLSEPVGCSKVPVPRTLEQPTGAAPPGGGVSCSKVPPTAFHGDSREG